MFKYANPAVFMRLSGILLPWVSAACIIAFAAGLFLAFRVPPDYQQGLTVMILFIHVPADVMMINAYLAIAVASFFSLVWRHPLADTAARAAAPLGALFTALALFTGSVWGRPMWGTFWVWDPRLVTTLLQLFLYLGYMALWNAFEDETRAARAAAVLALIGVVNLPIIHYSVDWWNSLHQGHTLLKLGRPSMPPSMYVPLIAMIIGFMLYFGAVLLVRARGELLRRERTARWLLDVVGEA